MGEVRGICRAWYSLGSRHQAGVQEQTQAAKMQMTSEAVLEFGCLARCDCWACVPYILCITASGIHERFLLLL